MDAGLTGPATPGTPEVPAAAASAAGAKKSAEARRRSDATWLVHVTLLSLLLGMLLALAIRTTERLRSSDSGGSRLQVSSVFLSRYKDQHQRLQDEVAELRRQRDEYMATVEDDSHDNQGLKAQFEELKLLGGLSPVEGPGIRVTLRDSTDTHATLDDPAFLIHDHDINAVISVLKRAGARYLAVSGADGDRLQRVIVSSTARCVGSVVMVNMVPLSGPYRLYAIGDSKELRKALEQPDGFVRTRGLQAKKMIVIEDQPHIALPEYSGTLRAQYARPVTQEQ
jgi:uncharacterized protein YlxW (UPF0749 family)